ncbi:MAG: hypothetical protein JO083_06525, partial [Candidatus Eremiobacteraeota bacterium]|nr:hypothetical protein [Candidatus Eremiobacteraeota bacterium]
RAVLLHDEAELLGRSPLRFFSAGFRRRREVALADVLGERVGRFLQIVVRLHVTVARVALRAVVVRLYVVTRFLHVRGDALAERHLVAFDGALHALTAGLDAVLCLVQYVVRVFFERIDPVVTAIHYCVPPPLVVVVVVDEPDVPEFVPPCVVVVVVPLVWDVVVEFQGCHTKSAISATTTMTATKLKVARDPPFSRSTEMLRSSIRDMPPGI